MSGRDIVFLEPLEAAFDQIKRYPNLRGPEHRTCSVLWFITPHAVSAYSPGLSSATAEDVWFTCRSRFVLVPLKVWSGVREAWLGSPRCLPALTAKEKCFVEQFLYFTKPVYME